MREASAAENVAMPLAARALVNEPAVLLLDEPLGALDLKLRKQMGIELKRIQREVGITFIYVTHDQEEAMTMSDRIAVMNKGRYEQLAGPETLYERPATRFVAGFVGASNLLEGRIGSDGESWTVTLPSGAVVRAPKSLGDIGGSGSSVKKVGIVGKGLDAVESDYLRSLAGARLRPGFPRSTPAEPR